jgi:hypothetical protein
VVRSPLCAQCLRRDSPVSRQSSGAPRGRVAWKGIERGSIRREGCLRRLLRA